jgi:hypothetical protein
VGFFLSPFGHGKEGVIYVVKGCVIMLRGSRAVFWLGLCTLFWFAVVAATFLPIFLIKIRPFMMAQSWPRTNCTVVNGTIESGCGYYSFGFACGVRWQMRRRDILVS